VCVCVYVCVCVCVCVCMCVCVYVCVCVQMFLSEYTTIISLNRINTFDFLMKIKCVFSKKGNAFNTTQMQYSFTR